MIRSKAKVTDGQGHRNSHKMVIDPHCALIKCLIKLDEPSPVFYNFTSQNMCMIKFEKKKSVDDSFSQNLGKSKMAAILLNVSYVKND